MSSVTGKRAQLRGAERERKEEGGVVWGEMERVNKPKTLDEKDADVKVKHCLQGSSISFITMRRYRRGTVIKVDVTVMLQAVCRYSNRASQSGRNLEDKSKAN